MSRLYKIGEVSRIFSLSAQTLRFYEQEGLLVPAVTDKETNYRYYSVLQFERLRQIIFFRDLGIPIKTIRDLLKQPNGEEYIQTLEKYRDGLRARIRNERSRLRFLDDKINDLRLASTLPRDQVMFLHFPEQHIIKYDRPITNVMDNELAVTEFIQKCRLAPGISAIGQLFSPDHLTSNGSIVSTSMYVDDSICTEETFAVPDLDQAVFPEGIYATMYYQKHTEDSLPYMYELLDETKRRGFTIASDIIRSVAFFDVENGRSGNSGYLARIRVLVRELNLEIE